MKLDSIKMMTCLIKQDLNMTDLADKSGLSRQTIYGIKAGRKCSELTAEKIATALGVAVKDIQ